MKVVDDEYDNAYKRYIEDLNRERIIDEEQGERRKRPRRIRQRGTPREIGKGRGSRDRPENNNDSWRREKYGERSGDH